MNIETLVELNIQLNVHKIQAQPCIKPPYHSLFYRYSSEVGGYIAFIERVAAAAAVVVLVMVVVLAVMPGVWRLCGNEWLVWRR